LSKIESVPEEGSEDSDQKKHSKDEEESSSEKKFSGRSHLIQLSKVGSVLLVFIILFTVSAILHDVGIDIKSASNNATNMTETTQTSFLY
jgi:hypothetical protein